MKKSLFLIVLSILFAGLIIVTNSLTVYSQESLSTEATLPETIETNTLKDHGDAIDGFPVLLDNQKLFVIQAPSGSFSPQERAETISKRLERIAQDSNLSLDTLAINQVQGHPSITLDNQVIYTILEQDARAARQSEEELAQANFEKIQEALTEYRQERTASARLLAVVFSIITTFSVIIIVIIINLTFPKIINLINRWRETIIPAVRIQNMELLSSHRVTDIIIGIVNFIRALIILAIIFIYIPSVLKFFPTTRRFGDQLFGYLISAVTLALESLIGYLPNIFIVLTIIVITYYLIRFIQVFFKEIERGNLTFPGFYPDWAEPTYKIVTFLVIALAGVIIFPYLPGSKSPAFQGISLFLGALFTLGGATAVANLVGGFILIYTRAFQLGDRVQIGEIIGDIEEKTILVTRIRTPKNVLVTLPNSTVLNSNVINFSASARDTGIPLIIHTTITLGYDIPWRKVHQVLIEAALSTDQILADPHPFVLQTGLEDFYVSYEINAYTQATTKIPKIYSELHQNIQDKCNAADIEILSPHYRAIRDGNETTIPETPTY